MIITKIEPQKKHKNRSSVFLDGSFAFGINDFDLHRLNLSEGQKISEGRLAEIRDEVLTQEARQYALRLLDAHPYTEQGLRRKLSERDTDPMAIERTIAFLQEYHYIDDFEYAKRYIASALRSGKSGMRKILYDVTVGKGVAKDVAEQAAAAFDSDESERILPLLEKKLKGDFSFQNIMKAKRYCLSRGFSYEETDQALRKLTSDEAGYDT